MKRLQFIFLFIISSSGLIAGTDNFTLSMQGLTIHPENQLDFAQYYKRKIDSNGDFVFTPGFQVSYDRALSDNLFTHVRFTGGYISDCALQPAWFAGAGGLFPLINKQYYSLYVCIGAGWYGRSSWKGKIQNYYSPVMKQSGSIEWTVLPFPEIELSLHPWKFPCSIVISFFSVIYVSQLSAGFQVRI